MNYLVFKCVCIEMSGAAIKKTMRKEMRSILTSLSAEVVETQSAAQAQHVLDMDAFKKSRGLSIYVPMKKELQTYALIKGAMEAGKRVFIPKVIGPNPPDMVMVELESFEQLASFPKSKWGIPEPPVEMTTGSDAGVLQWIDLVLLPGVAFDAECRRLGHGKGYYDCFLERLQQSRKADELAPATMVGICLEEQVLPCGRGDGMDIPTDAHDKILDYIVSPSRTFTVSH